MLMQHARTGRVRVVLVPPLPDERLNGWGSPAFAVAVKRNYSFPLIVLGKRLRTPPCADKRPGMPTPLCLHISALGAHKHSTHPPTSTVWIHIHTRHMGTTVMS